MPLPHLIYGICTKADSSAYTKQVWLTNENTNQRVSTVCDSSGNYIFDLANMDNYTNGDVLTLAIEAYGIPGFLVTKNSFKDTSTETIEPFDGQRLNTANLEMNFRISQGVSSDKARVEVFRKIWALIEKDAPSYTDRDGEIKTYEIVSAFPEITPTFPCIVVNPINKDTRRLGVDKRSKMSNFANITFEFYAKTCDGKNAIDSAKDKVEMIMQFNWITETVTVDTTEGGQIVNIEGVE